MKILLDHNLDWRLSRHLPGHEVKSASEMKMMPDVIKALVTIAPGQIVEIIHPAMTS